ncbi:MAG: hypothetical protein ACI3V5_10235 [Faecousia sp.]
MKKYIISMLMVLLLLSCLPVTVFAHAVPDENRKGSITVTMVIGEEAVPGGSLTLYRVGEVHEDDGNYSFIPTGDFTRWRGDFDDIQSPRLAASLAEYAEKLPGKTKQIGEDGKVTFSRLELGLYLLVQKEPASGYNKVRPFLVSVPYLKDGVYIYDVDANTKMELEKEPKPTTPPPAKPSGNKLPQTGQLNWPVPVMVVLGLGLFAAGWALRFLKRDGNAE